MPIEILMPALSPTMTEGNLAKWLKQEGDEVTSGEVIAEIETDKATMEVEAVDEGKIAKILVSEGSENVKVNQVIALLLEEGEDESVLVDYKVSSPEAEVKKEEVKSEEKTEKTEQASIELKTEAPALKASSQISDFSNLLQNRTVASTNNSSFKASPVAKNIAGLNNISFDQVKGTGPRGRIVKEDVVAHLESGNNTNVIKRNAEEAYAIKNNNVRKVIAKRLLEAKQTIPHFYLNLDCNLDNLMNFRAQLNSAAPVSEHGKAIYKISVNDLIIKACALALRDNPEANASWSDEAIIRYNNIDVSVAVAIDDGLITPIVKNAEQKSIIAISTEMKSLAKRAREGKLQPEEFQGGGFSISNLGMYGIKQFNAIVNPPQSCILAVGAATKNVVVGGDNQFKVANILSLTISCDHRVVDGAVGANLLTSIKHYLENPAIMSL